MMKSRTLMTAAALAVGAAGAAAYEVTIFPADANRDGYVSADEYTSHQEDMGQGRQRLAGPTVSQTGDAAQLGPTPAGEVSYRLADANRDGFVSQEEWQDYRQQIEQRRAAGGAPPSAKPPGVIVGVPPNESGEATYRQADLNRDGYVSNEEWEQYRQRLERQYRR